jgi:hypothetical protein
MVYPINCYYCILTYRVGYHFRLANRIFCVGNSVYLLHITKRADLIRSYGGKVGVQ